MREAEKRMTAAVLGGIVNSNGGGKCFRVTVPTLEAARKYKDMFAFILESDDFSVTREHCMYDRRG